MAGGTWSATDMPVLPGLYMNFVAAATAGIQTGARGVVAAPVKAHWGPVKDFTEITAESGIIDAYTADETGGATAYTTLRFALLGGAQKILAYRLADNNAAAATLTLQDTSGTPVNVLQINALYPGERGNNFQITVQVNPVDGSKKDIKLYEDTTLLRTFTFTSGTIQAAADAINNDSSNKWINASLLTEGDGTLADLSNQAMSGGNSGIAGLAAGDYTTAQTAFETRDFNIIALDGISDGATQTSYAAWIARIRQEGKGVILVVGGPADDDSASDAVSRATTRSASLNSEGIVNVGVGVELDGAVYSGAQAAAYVAGLIAGQKLSESVTYAPTPFDDVARRWTKSEMEQAVSGGVLLLFNDGRMVKPLSGINSLVTLSQGQNTSWKKIRTIRVMDAINSDLATAAEDNYIGKVNNNEEGRLALIGACKQYMKTLEQGGVIDQEGWDVYLDPVYYGQGATITPEADQVYLKWEASLTDVMEQIFGTFIVK